MKKGYGVGIAFSLSMHGLLIALMVTTFEMPQKPRTVVPPAYVNATLLVVDGVPQMEARTEPAPDPAPPPPPPPPQEDPQEEQRRQEEARRAQERAEEAQRQEEEQRREEQRQQEAERAEAARLKAEEEAKRKADEEAKRKADEEARRKAEEEAKRKAEEEARRKAEEEARRKAEEEARRKAEEERRRAEAAAEAERQRREEEQFMQAAAAREAVNTYEGLVQQRIADRWSRPPSARRDMEVELSISMTPNGQIQDVAIVRSSGDPAFDQSAVHAVQRVDRIPEFQQLDPAIFNANFRRFNLLFRPDDLRL